MNTYTISGRKFKACGSPCAEGFREDRRHGVIHGPYCDENGALYQNAEAASMAADFCAYCGSDAFGVLPNTIGSHLDSAAQPEAAK